MKTLIFYFFLFIALTFISACANSPKSDGIDYFSKSGIEIPKYSSDEVNNHLNTFKSLWNVRSTAVKNDDKPYSPELSIQFSNWTIKALKLEDKLRRDERKTYYVFIEHLTRKWDEKRNNLD